MKRTSHPQLGQGKTMRPAAPRCSCLNDRQHHHQCTLNSNGSASNAFAQAASGDAPVPRRPKLAHAHGHTPTSGSLDEQLPLPLLMHVEASFIAAAIERKEKASEDGELEQEVCETNTEQRRQSDYTTDACGSGSSLNFSLNDSQSSISTAPTKSKSGKHGTKKSTRPDPYQTNVSSFDEYSSSSSTELLYRALQNDQALGDNDFSSLSTEIDPSTSSHDDKKPQSRSQNFTSLHETDRKSEIHPTAQDSSVSSLSYDSTLSSVGLAHSVYDSSSFSGSE
jgi:hypothetical protein